MLSYVPGCLFAYLPSVDALRVGFHGIFGVRVVRPQDQRHIACKRVIGKLSLWKFQSFSEKRVRHFDHLIEPDLFAKKRMRRVLDDSEIERDA